MRNRRFPKYPDDTDYNTNSPSYYDDLARKQKLIEMLAKKIWEYEETLDLTLEQISDRLESYIEENDNLMTDRLEQWDLNLEKFPENVELLLQEWLTDGTLDHIINDTIFNWKADQSELDKTNVLLEQTASNFQSTEENEQAIISDNELVDGEGWTIGQGWSGNFSLGFTHVTGNTDPLTFTLPNVANKMFQIEVTVQSPSTTRESNSGWSMSIGDSEPFEMYEGNFTEHTYVRGIRSGSGNDFVIYPESAFDGTITNVSIKEITGLTSPTLVMKDSNGAHVLEITSTGADNRNVFIGKDIARYNTTGNRNVAIGDRAFADNTSGFWNVAIGDEAMMNNTVGSRSVAIGHIALRHNTVGHRNIAIGPFTLEQNTTGTNNVAIGVDPMQFGKNAHFNIAIGTSTLTRIEDGEDNIALGRGAGSTILGSGNIALGRSAMVMNEDGDNSVAIGTYTLNAATGGTHVAIGYRALWKLTTGTQSTVLGHEALQNLTEGTGNIGIGHGVGNSLTTGSRNILIGGNVLNATDSNKINIGEHFYADTSSHKTYLGRRQEPTAILELREGTGLSGGAPLKFNDGNLLSNPEAGTFEFKDGVLYFTAVEGQRKEVTLA